MTFARWLLILGPASLALAAPRVAEACSPLPCRLGSLHPQPGAAIPANFPGVLWHPMIGSLDTAPVPGNVTLARFADPETAIPFTATELAGGGWLLVPDAALTPGERYTVVDATVCDRNESFHGPSTGFDVTATARLPSTLGTIAATHQRTGQRSVGTQSGSCVSNVTAAQAAIELALAEDTAPWADALQFELLVDDSSRVLDASYTKPSAAKLVFDTVFRTCATTDAGAEHGLSAGTHTFQVRASLPGSTTVLMSSSITLALSCPDEGKPPVVVEPPIDGDPDSDDGGCSSTRSATLPWLGLPLGAVLLRRRRARSA